MRREREGAKRERDGKELTKEPKCKVVVFSAISAVHPQHSHCCPIHTFSTQWPWKCRRRSFKEWKGSSPTQLFYSTCGDVRLENIGEVNLGAVKKVGLQPDTICCYYMSTSMNNQRITYPIENRPRCYAKCTAQDAQASSAMPGWLGDCYLIHRMQALHYWHRQCNCQLRQCN